MQDPESPYGITPTVAFVLLFLAGFFVFSMGVLTGLGDR